MQLPSRFPARTAAAAVGLALVVIACTDRTNPAGPGDGGGGTHPRTPPATPINVQALECSARVKERTVSCAAPSASRAAGLPSYLIVGGQNVYVQVATVNPDYNSGTQAFTFDLTIRNLIPQPLGTTDANTLAPDANGVRLFFHDGPTVTSGTGTITVAGDGTDNFTASNQPYYQYNAVLEEFEVSSARTWQLNMPNTVNEFTFLLMVSAAVPYPDGYIDVAGNTSVRSGNVRTLTAVVRSPVGNIDEAATITDWTSGDPLLADYDSETGATAVVHGLRAGSVTLTVSATRVNYANAVVPVSGTHTLTVTPVRRYWTANGATDDWNDGNNWLPDSIKPQPTDTAVVVDSLASTFPFLAQNEATGGVEVDDFTPGGVIPTIALGAFNLTASGDVFTTNNASIGATVGRVLLTGTARTVRGTLPRVTVSGTYSLDGNLTLNHNLRVQGGRLRSTSFRVRVNNP
jgi:hypothetical protein